VDPIYVTQTTIAVTMLHKIHYSIEVPKTLLVFKISTSGCACAHPMEPRRDQVTFRHIR